MKIRTMLTRQGRINFLADDKDELKIVLDHYKLKEDSIRKYKNSYVVTIE